MEYKAPDAYRTISEVAEELDLPQHVLRFWETRFGQIKPLKRGGGRRYYRPDDIDLLKGIRQLLYGEGYTIKGVQRILKEHGAADVLALGRGAPGALAMIAGGPARASSPRMRDAEPFAPPPDDDATADVPQKRLAGGPNEAARDLFHGAPAPSGPDAVADGGDGAGEEPLPGGILPDDRPVRPARFVGRMLGHEPARTGLTREEVRRLQATLVELLECKRLLDLAK